MEISKEKFASSEKRHEHDWESCLGSFKFVLWQYKRVRVRCPDCNKRLLLCDTDDKNICGACFYLPRHKPKTLKRKKNI